VNDTEDHVTTLLGCRQQAAVTTAPDATRGGIHDTGVAPASLSDASTAPTRGVRALLLAFCVLTAAAVVSLVAGADRTGETFAWTIQPPIGAAFLGSGYLAGFVLSVLAVRSGDWREVRVPYVTVLVFTWVTAIATFYHLHRLHMATPGTGPMAEPAAWSWLAVYAVVPTAMTVLLPRQPRLTARARAGSTPVRMPRGLTALLGLQGVVMAVVGIRLLVRCLSSHGAAPTLTHRAVHTATHTPAHTPTHSGAQPLVPTSVEPLWPWPVTPLACGVMAAWLLAFALAVALCLADGDLSRLRTAALAYAVFGAAQLLNLLRFRDDVAWSAPAAWPFVIMLVAVTATGLVGAVLSARAGPGRAVHVAGRSAPPAPRRHPIGS
jgi:hypothetical protein